MKSTMQVVLIIVVFSLLGTVSAKSYSQDSTSVKHSWYLEGGQNMLIPIRKYIENSIYNSRCDDCIVSKYEVMPKFTATNFYITGNYTHTLYSHKRSNINVTMSLGYQHYETEIKRLGYYYNGFTGSSFNGIITQIEKNDFVFFDLAFPYTIKIKRKLSITNQLSISANLLFHKYSKTNENGLDSKYGAQSNTYVSNTWGIGNYGWGIRTYGLMLNYRFALLIPLNSRISLIPKLDMPLLLISSLWQNKSGEYFTGEIKSYSLTPYFTSINNLSFINIGVGLTYKIR